MSLHRYFSAAGSFLSHHGRGSLLLASALLVAGGFWLWQQPPWPQATWRVFDADSGCALSPDGKTFIGLSALVVRTQNGNSSERPVGPVRLWDTATGEERLRILGTE